MSCCMNSPKGYGHLGAALDVTAERTDDLLHALEKKKVPYINSKGAIKGLSVKQRIQEHFAGDEKALRRELDITSYLMDAMDEDSKDQTVHKTVDLWLVQSKKDCYRGVLLKQWKVGLDRRMAAERLNASQEDVKAEDLFILEDNKRLIKKWEEAGFPVKNLIPFPDFMSFINMNYYDKHIATLGHDIQIDEESKEPVLLVEGQLSSWSEIKKKFYLRDGGTRLLINSRDPWDYLGQGLVPWANKRLETWKPYMVLPEDKRPAQHSLEVLTGHRSHSGGSGLCDWHSWMRIIDSETGEVRSVGVFRTPPTTPFETLETVPGILLTPDTFEFLPGVDAEKAAIPLNQEQFDAVKKYIEDLCKERFTYRMTGMNCVDLLCGAVEVALNTGVEDEEKIELKPHLTLGTLAPMSAQKDLDKIKKTFPRASWAVGHYGESTLRIATMPLLYGMGGKSGLKERCRKRWNEASNNESWQPEDERAKAAVRGIGDVLSRKRINISHPKVLRLWQRKQEGWAATREPGVIKS